MSAHDNPQVKSTHESFRGYYAALKWVMPHVNRAGKPNVLAVYMAVADYAFLAGGPFVGIDTICEKTGLTRRKVDIAIRDGKDLGVLRAHKGRGRAGTSYWELARTQPFTPEQQDNAYQLAPGDVLGGKPTVVKRKSGEPHHESVVSHDHESVVSGHHESVVQVVLVEFSEIESSEILNHYPDSDESRARPSQTNGTHTRIKALMTEYIHNYSPDYEGTPTQQLHHDIHWAIYDAMTNHQLRTGWSNWEWRVFLDGIDASGDWAGIGDALCFAAA